MPSERRRERTEEIIETLLCTLELEENEEEIKMKSPADSAILHVYSKRVFYTPYNSNHIIS